MDEPTFTVVAHLDPPHARLGLSGELDALGCLVLETHLEQALAAGCRSFELDLPRVSFIDAAGLGALVRARTRLRAPTASVSYRNPSAVVLRVAALGRLCGLLADG